MKAITALLFGLLILAPSRPSFASAVTIPRGTAIFVELDERITSNARKFRVGYPVDGHVWKDVAINGRIVIAAGAPMVLRISKLDTTGVGGRGGTLAVMAVSVQAVDGTEISLTGGYDEDGKNLYGLTRALSYVVWPTAFLPGRKAVLDKGTVFDAAIPANTVVDVPEDEIPTIKLSGPPDLSVDISYDDFDARDGTLPMHLTLCNQEFVREAEITAVNDRSVRPILVTIITSHHGEPCHDFEARVNLETLGKHFKPGINRFTVSMAEAEASTVLNIEM